MMNECWLWAGPINRDDYGRWGSKMAHRLLYELLVNKMKPNLELDHLCGVRRCVNPAHLEPVTRQENAKRTRKEYCIRGHLFNKTTEYWNFNKRDSALQRSCKVCKDLARKKYSERSK